MDGTDGLFLLSSIDWAVAATSGGLGAATTLLTAVVGTILLLGPVAACAAFMILALHAPRGTTLTSGAEMHAILSRIAASTALLTAGTIWLVVQPDHAGIALATTAMGVATAWSWLFLADLIAAPGRDRPRKLLGIVLEATALSFVLYAGDVSAAPFFVVYFWIVLAPGLRYGAKWLIPSTVAGAAAFGAVAVATPIWQQNWPLSAGLWATLIALPLIVAPTLRKLNAERTGSADSSAAHAHLLTAMNQALRGPLDTISGLAELMRQTELSRDQAAMLDMVRSTSRGLLTTVDNLLDFSKIAAGAPLEAWTGFDLPSLIASAAAEAAPAASGKGLMFGVQIDPLLPDIVEGHPETLRRLLVSLTLASIRLAERGEVRLTVERRNETIRFNVRDTGGGRAYATAHRVFAQAADADHPSGPTVVADDLSFALAWDMARQMHGTILAHGENGIGSRLVVAVPLIAGIQNRGRPLAATRIGLYGPDKSLQDALAARPGLEPLNAAFPSSADLPIATRQRPKIATC